MRTLIVLIVSVLLFGCAEQRHGRLLIIGGALSSENTPVFRALESEPDERLNIVVIPVASGVPEKSGPGTAMELHANLNSPTVTVIDPRTAPMADVVRAIDGADAVWFTGGDQSRITEHMRNTPAHDACFRLLKRGGVIAGTSAGAAMMGETMITGGRDEEVTTADGMGFLPGVLTDQHFKERERQPRLTAAMERTGIQLGLGVNEDRAVLVEVEGMMLTPVGEQPFIGYRLQSNGIVIIMVPWVWDIEPPFCLRDIFHHAVARAIRRDEDSGPSPIE